MIFSEIRFPLFRIMLERLVGAFRRQEDRVTIH